MIEKYPTDQQRSGPQGHGANEWQQNGECVYVCVYLCVRVCVCEGHLKLKRVTPCVDTTKRKDLKKDERAEK